MKLKDIPIGCTFRLDYEGKINNAKVIFAGKGYTKIGDDLLRAYDGRQWSFADCGFTQDTECKGPIWGVSQQ